VAVCCCLVGRVYNTGVSSSGGIVAMGMADVTMLHTFGRGEPELSPSLEAESSSLGDSSWMACSDGDPLRVTPLTIAPESLPSRDRLKLLARSAMNSRSLEWMAGVFSEPDAD
jgi:hypothetical protein